MSAVISAARIAAAHDGEAELIVELTFENGGKSEVTLDELATRSLMRRCGARTMDELAGHGWEHVREALAESYDRFNQGESRILDTN